ncbi:response regulator transcription factor [Paenibacillus barengoltzii]|uniref:response regulator transcription factor n=1 Tax=Paenibacillus barengoltzii TaxID=343517 RepID=UPI003F8C140D
MKICVADDEMEVRLSIIQKLTALFPDEQIFDVGFGRQAAEQITLVKPDLVFLDIRMPEMDGIEILRFLKETSSRIHVVIISGYDEFEYARKSLQLGAMDYLLKPADRIQLSEIVEKVQKELTAALLTELDLLVSKEPGVRAILKEIHPVNASLWFDERIWKRIQFEDGPPSADFLSREILLTFVTDAGNRGKVVQTNLDQGGGCFREKKKFAEALLLEYQRNRQTFFFQLKGEEAALNPKERKEAAKRAAKMRQEMISRARGGDFAGLERDLERWFDCLEQAGYEELQKECGYLMSLLDEGLSKQEIIYLEEDTLYYWADWVARHRTWDELKGKIKKIVLGGVKALKNLEQQQEQHASGLQPWLLEALRLVENCSDPNVSLEWIAEEVNVHPVTLSRIFKQQTGMNFVKYLTQKRLRMARTLLLETNKKINEIAEEVGYADYPYFRSKFKKEFGLSPSEFRKSQGIASD